MVQAETIKQEKKEHEKLSAGTKAVTTQKYISSMLIDPLHGYINSRTDDQLQSSLLSTFMVFQCFAMVFDTLKVFKRQYCYQWLLKRMSSLNFFLTSYPHISSPFKSPRWCILILRKLAAISLMGKIPLSQLHHIPRHVSQCFKLEFTHVWYINWWNRFFWLGHHKLRNLTFVGVFSPSCYSQASCASVRGLLKDIIVTYRSIKTQ